MMRGYILSTCIVLFIITNIANSYVSPMHNTALLINLQRKHSKPMYSEQKSYYTNSHCLYVSKHLSRYGPVFNSQPSPKPVPKVLPEDIVSKELVKKYTAQMMNDRADNKDQGNKHISVSSSPIGKRERSTSQSIVLIGKPRKWSDEKIETVIECLNRSYGNKQRSELTMNERVGLIDWVKFEEIGRELIEDYNEKESVRKKVQSWIKYHCEKKEIVFDFDKWIWKPRKPYWPKPPPKAKKPMKKVLKLKIREARLAKLKAKAVA